MATLLPRRGALSGAFASLICLFSLDRLCPAQCQLDWQQGAAPPGIIGSLSTLAYAGNGDLVVAGRFQVVGLAAASNIARFDGVAWRALGAGTDGTIDVVAFLPNGDLVVGGQFQNAGGVPARNIARWNGVAWSPLGAGVDGPVRDLAVLPNGALAVVGPFSNAGSVAASKVAVFDGNVWSARGVGPSVQTVVAVDVLPGGDLVVGGESPVGVNDVERWNGTSWQPLAGVGTGQMTLVVDLQVLPNGSLAIAGNVIAGTRLGVWDGAQLLAQASPFSQIVELDLAANGDLVAAGDGIVSRFDGAAWNQLGTAVQGSIRGLALAANGAVAVATSVLPGPQLEILQLVGGSWSPMLTAPELEVGPIEALPNGDLVIGGEFDTIGGVAAANVARFDGTAWRSLGLGVDGRVWCLAVGPDGAVVVGGEFLAAGGSPVQRIARWNGASWSSLGAGLAFVPLALAVGEDGSVLAVGSGSTAAARFDGTAWQSIALLPGVGRRAVALPGGEFLVAGTFVQLGAPVTIISLLRINGSVASIEPGFASQTIGALLRLADGSVVVSRASSGSSDLVRIQGSSVQSISPSVPGALLHLQQLPDGDFVVAHRVNTEQSEVLRLRGATWSTMLGGIGTDAVADLAVSARGEVAVSGSFDRVGDQVSYAFARAAVSCPADVTTFGAGCVGAAGPVELRTADRPWLGSTVRQAVTGMAPLSISLHVVGIGTAVNPLPLAAPGCFGLVAPVASELLFPSGGAVQAPLAILPLPALVGVRVFTQVIGLELDATASWVRTTASNALQLTIGAF